MLDERNLDLNEGPTNADRRHAVDGERAVRGAVGPRADGRGGRPVHRAERRSRSTTATVDANRNNIAVDPIAAGTYSGTGLNAITVENDGGPQRRAAVRASMQIDLRAGYRLRPSAGTVDRLLLRGVQPHERAELRESDRRSAARDVPRPDVAGGRRVPAAVPDRRAVRILGSEIQAEVEGDVLIFL